MSDLQLPYQKFGISEIPAPVVGLTIKDLLGENETKVLGLIDTGYDGFLIIPPAVYNKVGLSKFELDIDNIPPIETFGGERIPIKSANGLVRIDELSEDFLCEIDSHEICTEVLIGRQLLAFLRCILDGPEESLSFEFEALK